MCNQQHYLLFISLSLSLCHEIICVIYREDKSLSFTVSRGAGEDFFHTGMLQNHYPLQAPTIIHPASSLLTQGLYLGLPK